MIEINLVPIARRKRKKSGGFLGGGQGLPREALIGSVGGIFVLLLAVHILLQLLITVKFIQHKSYNKEWSRIMPEKEEVDAIMNNLKTLRSKYSSIEQVTQSKRVVWSRILNEVSNNLPRGTWLNRIEIDNDALLIQGSAVSKNKSEMVEVHQFTANLKKSEDFSKHFANIELGLIKSRKISTTPIADFTVIADLKLDKKEEK